MEDRADRADVCCFAGSARVVPKIGIYRKPYIGFSNEFEVRSRSKHTCCSVIKKNI
jgi:hypothetical protein